MFLGTETFSISMEAHGADSVLAFLGGSPPVDGERALVRAVAAGRTAVATVSSYAEPEAREVAGGGAK